MPAEEDEASALYRTVVADRRLLIVLDNALDADQVRPLLPGSSRGLVVVPYPLLLGQAASNRSESA
jgi:hypothetical protein